MKKRILGTLSNLIFLVLMFSGVTLKIFPAGPLMNPSDQELIQLKRKLGDARRNQLAIQRLAENIEHLADSCQTLVSWCITQPLLSDTNKKRIQSSLSRLGFVTGKIYSKGATPLAQILGFKPGSSGIIQKKAFVPFDLRIIVKGSGFYFLLKDLKNHGFVFAQDGPAQGMFMQGDIDDNPAGGTQVSCLQSLIISESDPNCSGPFVILLLNHSGCNRYSQYIYQTLEKTRRALACLSAISNNLEKARQCIKKECKSGNLGYHKDYIFNQSEKVARRAGKIREQINQIMKKAGQYFTAYKQCKTSRREGL